MNERNQYHPVDVSPPGATLDDVLTERGMTQTDLAERIGCSVEVITALIHGHACMSVEVAHQLERVLAVPATFWLTREHHYRASLALAAQAACSFSSSRC